MKKMYFLFVIATLLFKVAAAQQPPIEEKYLMDPAELATRIETNSNQSLILCLGPQDLIKGSVDIGEGREAETIRKLKTYLEKQDKNRAIVIYCGCCPLTKCPNTRPALAQALKMGFTKVSILNLATNLKVDWLDKNYPAKEE
ncbi:hypothetical protein J2T02_002489 [Chitinophaga terrae (ex Kim and Jung 2007)]|jgi:hypothetical protein|uniref:rhodanese-like domain-containing protein n=1 Tax=Chitinophaga terrae (ex Kim and Jung 2007) TaxID=408074 RepID=UPI002785B54F|nr:rhodanese-like domain-containing protein [Chitinophaga terrae (ex Kim and Jung 2007)]MDQ0107370.1 hypothetical protein [Chitinophaga terrae (ex Kim and Jung 2007)]